MPPPHLSFGQQWCLGLFAQRGAAAAGGAGPLQGVVMVTRDLCAPGVWHLGLFIVATCLHGRGVADAAYAALEAWVRRSGARHLRLSVVKGNGRAERFWARQGFVELRAREGVDTGGRVNTVRVMLKPLLVHAPPGSAAMAEVLQAYWQIVPRDRPGSPLP